GVLDGTGQAGRAERVRPAQDLQRVRFRRDRVGYVDSVIPQRVAQPVRDLPGGIAGEDAAHGTVEVQQERPAAGQQRGQAIEGGHDSYSRAMLFHSESNQTRDASTNCVPMASSSLTSYWNSGTSLPNRS